MNTLRSINPPIIEGLPEFSGGAVGCFSYDLVRLSENLPNVPEDDLEQPDMHFMFTDEIIAFDNKKKAGAHGKYSSRRQLKSLDMTEP